MADNFTEITSINFFTRFKQAIKGFVTGLVTFLISFVILYLNEGTVDLAQMAKQAVQIEPTGVVADVNNGKLVAVTGQLGSEEQIGNSFVKKGNYLGLRRITEMYAWIENKSIKNDNNLGGSQTQTTTYKYVKGWTEKPQNYTKFKYTKGHVNPQALTGQVDVVVKKAHLGNFSINMGKVQLPEYRDFQLKAGDILLKKGVSLQEDRYLFSGQGSFASPLVGDIRIHYEKIVNPLETATVFGKLDLSHERIVAFYGDKNTILYRLFEGTREGSIGMMHSEYQMRIWIIRLVGFVLMWLGLAALFGPISIVLDILPILGDISRGMIGVVTFLVSLVLSIITIIVAMVAHSVMALVIVIILFIAFVAWYVNGKKIKAAQKTI